MSGRFAGLGSAQDWLDVTLDYEQEQLDGPPFAVSRPEVEGLSERGWQVALLDEQDVLADSVKARNAGATRLDEHVYRLQR